jgi:hypothetical protein
MRREYVRKFVDWLVEECEKRECVYGISGGDLTSSDHLSATEISTLDYVASKLSNQFVYVKHILGNHERKDKEGLHSSLEMITAYDGQHLVKTVETFQLDNTLFVLTPFGCEDEMESFDVDQYIEKHKIAISHLDLVPGGSGFVGLDTTRFKKYTRVFNGHIHNPSAFENVVNVGSPLGSNFADSYSVARPGIIFYDTITGEYERVENPTAPLYWKVFDGNLPPKDLLPRSIIKLVVKDGEQAPEVVDCCGLVHEIEGSEVEVDHSVDISEDIFETLKEFYKNDEKYVSEINRMRKSIEEGSDEKSMS